MDMATIEYLGFNRKNESFEFQISSETAFDELKNFLGARMHCVAPAGSARILGLRSYTDGALLTEAKAKNEIRAFAKTTRTPVAPYLDYKDKFPLFVLGFDVAKTFTPKDWLALGEITGSQAIIDAHPALLDEQAPRDLTYQHLVFEVLEMIHEQSKDNLWVIRAYLDGSR